MNNLDLLPLQDAFEARHNGPRTADVAGALPADARTRPFPSFDAALREQPSAGGAAGCACERACGRGTLARPPRFGVFVRYVLSSPDDWSEPLASGIRALAGPASQTPIVALTADIDPELEENCRKAGVSQLAAKPIDPPRLREIAMRWVQFRQKAAE